MIWRTIYILTFIKDFIAEEIITIEVEEAPLDGSKQNPLGMPKLKFVLQSSWGFVTFSWSKQKAALLFLGIEAMIISDGSNLPWFVYFTYHGKHRSCFCDQIPQRHGASFALGLSGTNPYRQG
ncbi:hypothetical protein V6N12_063516 [Hibiscus sabdariffa]|uniref:Uncharacterized protein n=1 Tax=Hibiscus sabdariffa TaxID=183260 RepID=A0ABR2FBY2_9ROSI